MFERFTNRARRVVVLAQEEARLLDHDYIGTEHLLLGLLHEGEGLGAQTLVDLGVDLQSARREVIEIIGRGEQTPPGRIPFTPRAKKVMELSLRESLQLGHRYIGTEHVLLGLIREGKGVALKVLKELDVDPGRLRQRVIELLEAESHGAGEPARVSGPAQDSLTLEGIQVFAHHGAMPKEQEEGQEFLIDLVLQLDLSGAGASDDLEDTVDYKALAERVAERVARERWNLLERVAERIAELILEDRRVYSVGVTVHKPAAPIGVPVADVAVTVVRRR